jgi:glycosyltransferase involved in cell wall biosynthesis
LPKISYNTNKG